MSVCYRLYCASPKRTAFEIKTGFAQLNENKMNEELKIPYQFGKIRQYFT